MVKTCVVVASCLLHLCCFRSQMKTVARTVSLRILPGLCVYLVAAIGLYSMGLMSIPAVSALALATISPMTPRSLELTHVFRLNENLVAATTRYSMYIASACALVFVLATQQALHDMSIIPLASALGLTALFIWLVGTYSSSDGASESDFYARTVKMVYKGPTREDKRPNGGNATAALPRIPRSPRIFRQQKMQRGFLLNTCYLKTTPSRHHVTI